MSELYYETINTPEFKSFLYRVGGKIVSSKVQIKRANIQVLDENNTTWVLYSNGIVRKQTTLSDRLGKISGFPLESWPENPTVEDMKRMINHLFVHLDRLEKQLKKLNTEAAKQGGKIISIIFDPELFRPLDRWIPNPLNIVGWYKANNPSMLDLYRYLINTIDRYEKIN